MQLLEARASLDSLDRRARRFATPTDPAGRMAWRCWGVGPPLLMLHGGAGSWMHWVRNIEALSGEHTLWVPDLPGFGDSDLPREGLDADSIAPFVLAGADELLGGQDFDLLGFSFGSLVAGYMAHLAPEKVSRLVIAGATGLGVHVGPRHALRALRGITDEKEREQILRHNLGAIMIHDPSHIDALAVAVQDRSAQRDRVRGRKLARSDAMLRLAPTWRCPVHGIWGQDDTTRRRDPEAFDSAAARMALAGKHVLPDAGHWVQFEVADTFNALVSRLLGPGTHRSSPRSVRRPA